MKIFPDYNNEDRKSEVKSSLLVIACFGILTLVCGAMFILGGSDFPPSGESWWGNVRWISLLVAVVALYLLCQSVIELLIAATMGPERFFAHCIVGFVVVGLLSWLIW